MLWFYVPPTAKVIWRRDLDLKSHPKDWSSPDRTHDPWFTMRAASFNESGYIDNACVHGSTNGTNGRQISFKVLPMVPLVIPLVPMVPLVKTDGSQYCRQSTVWAKLPTLESHMIKYGVLNFKFINFTNKHCFLSG